MEILQSFLCLITLKLVIIEDTILTWVYQQEGLPQMTVNCFVGMNGVGKSKKKLKMVLNR